MKRHPEKKLRITMKNMPESEQPYEKFLASGPERLSDAELLAVIIRTGSREESSVELSKKILSMPGQSNNLLNIIDLSIKDLQQLKGIGLVKAVQIKSIAELSRRISKTVAKNRLCMDNPATIAEYYMEDLRFVNQEMILLVMLDTKNCIICDRVISVGTVNSSLITPREIFLEALKWQAVHVVLLHNHPSKDPTPSREDIEATLRICRAGSIVGISVLDHIIIGDRRYVSLKEQGTI